MLLELLLNMLHTSTASYHNAAVTIVKFEECDSPQKIMRA